MTTKKLSTDIRQEGDVAHEWFDAKMNEKGEHSPLGPSSSHRWMKCPGSLHYRHVPDTTSDYAEEGTLAHLVTEYCRLFDVPAEALVGVRYGKQRVTKVMASHCQGFVDLCGEYEGDMEVEYRVDFSEYVRVETRHGGVIQGFGTIDDLRMRPGHAVITDFKYGKGVSVEAKDNPQLLLLALGVLQEFDHIYEFKTFKLCIHQPRAGGWKECDMTKAQLLEWYEKVAERAVQRVNDALWTDEPRDEDFGPSLDKNTTPCRFCPGKNMCKARIGAIVDALPPVGTVIGPESLAPVLFAMDGVMQVAKDLKEQGKAYVMVGERVPGWKCVHGRSSRKVKDEEGCIKYLKRKKYKVTDYRTKPVLKSPAQLEQAVDKEHKQELQDYFAVLPGPVTLVPEWDPRPSIAINPETEFSVQVDTGDDDGTQG